MGCKLSDESFRYLIQLIMDQGAENRQTMQEGFSKLEGLMEEQDRRIIRVEQFNWKVTAVCVAVVFVAEVAFRIAEVTLGKS